MHILSIVGPTAVGKSAAALAVANELLAVHLVAGVDIISADSRQVYRGLELLTGADIPDDCALVVDESMDPYSFFQLQGKPVFLHGQAIIKPTEEWSLAHFQQLVIHILSHAVAKNHAVILVGGTGLYQTQVLQETLTGSAPPLSSVREQAETMSVAQLQSWLVTLDQETYATLNQSDRANPRRLVRAIERKLWQQLSAAQADTHTHTSELTPLYHQHYFGLQTDKTDLEHRIRLRVQQRLDQDVVGEVMMLEARLAELGISLTALPVYSSCGLKEVLAFARGDIDRQACLELWTRREKSYARRQDTWWKKRAAVQWFAIDQPHWRDQLLTAVVQAYSR